MSNTFLQDHIPISIDCSFQEFVSNYIKAKKTYNDSSILFLINNLDSNFSIWDSLVATKQFTKSIVLLTLFKLIKKDNKPEGSFTWKIKSILSYFKRTGITFKDLCIEAFLAHIRKPTKVFSRYNNQVKFFYFLSKELKSFLFKSLRKILQETKRDYYTNSSYFTFVKKQKDLHIDYNCLSYLQDEDILLYSAYLHFIANQKVNKTYLKSQYSLDDETSEKLKGDLCQLIETLLYVS